MKTMVVPETAYVDFPLDFWLRYFRVNQDEVFEPNGELHTIIEIELSLHMGGEDVAGSRKLGFEETAELSPVQEHTGPFDLMESLCH